MNLNLFSSHAARVLKLALRCSGTSLLLLSSLGSARAAEPLLAFPGAEGFGAHAEGGREGLKYFVTTLEDYALDEAPILGSFRAACEARGPRIILFRVSGIIHLKAPLVLGHLANASEAAARSFVTIAGQSAPGGGVTIADYPFILGGGIHNVVIQHLRFRNSDDDGIHFHYGVRRAIFDHCSISWGTDENVGFMGGGNQDVTFQNCVNAEALRFGGHDPKLGMPAGPGGLDHALGYLFSRGAHRISIVRNYMANNRGRNPQMVGNNVEDRTDAYGIRFPLFDMRNNLLYNCQAWTVQHSGAKVNIIGNYYQHGPEGRGGSPVLVQTIGDADVPPEPESYLEGNFVSWIDAAADQWKLVSVRNSRRQAGESAASKNPTIRASSPFEGPAIRKTVPADAVVNLVLPVAGALPYDEVDQRLRQEFLTGTGRIGAPDRTHASPTPSPAAGRPEPDIDDDGMPDAWERSHGLNPRDPLDADRDRNGDGYTNIEEYLADRAAHLEREAREAFQRLKEGIKS